MAFLSRRISADVPPSMSLDALRLWFRAINSGGAPMSAEDLERALAAAGD